MSIGMRRLSLGAAAVLLAIACADAGNAGTAPRTRAIAGTYDATTSGGGTVVWTLSQTDTAITGSGTFAQSGADSAVATYAIRGTMRLDQLAVRLLGGPGEGGAAPGEHSPLAGTLEIVRRDTTP